MQLKETGFFIGLASYGARAPSRLWTV